ncbi:hypothetical protein [uncultured Sphingomonas sp.]|uniref:hypothetical protein n=1 Tax=uncultured Sphingomonas sp. TaxID=158754 RepID=UPI0035C96D7B
MAAQPTPDAVLAAIQQATAVLQASKNTASATTQAAYIAAGVAVAAAVITLVAGLINAWVARRNARFQVIVTQKLKHAEFRQNWINVLREQMAKFQALAYSDPTEKKIDQDLAEAMLRVLMQLNREDPNYPALTKLMYAVMNYRRAQAGRSEENQGGQGPIVSHALMPDDPLANECAEFIMICQDILKSEWDVTKKGIYSLRPDYPEEQDAAVRTITRVRRLRIGWGPARDTKAVPPPPLPARTGWRSIPGRIKAAAVHMYDGRALT